MLPFLKKKDVASTGLIVKTRAPDEKTDNPEESQDDTSAGSIACMQSLINAIHGRDAKGAVEAFKDLMEVVDSSSDSDSPSPHTYQDQNIKAGEES
jgi:hypothetical protein